MTSAAWEAIIPLSQPFSPDICATPEPLPSGTPVRRKSLYSRIMNWKSENHQLRLRWVCGEVQQTLKRTWLQVASTRCMPWEKSSDRVMESSFMMSKKDGQPGPTRTSRTNEQLELTTIHKSPLKLSRDSCLICDIYDTLQNVLQLSVASNRNRSTRTLTWSRVKFGAWAGREDKTIIVNKNKTMWWWMTSAGENTIYLNVTTLIKIL